MVGGWWLVASVWCLVPGAGGSRSRATARCGRVAACCDRKECRWKVGGPPARNFIVRRADQNTQDTQDTQDAQDMAGTWREALPMNRKWPWREALPTHRKWPWREALSMHRPGCLGCPGCPGQDAGPAKRPGAYPGHWHAHCRHFPGTMRSRRSATLPCAVKAAAFPAQG